MVLHKITVWMRAQAHRLLRWCGTTGGKIFLVVLVLALAIRLLIAPYQGFFGDNQIDVGWGVDLDHTFFHVYSAVGSYGDPLVYPPLMVYLFGLMDGVYALLVHLGGGHPTFDASQAPLVDVLIKLPSLLADLGTASLIYWLTRQVRSERWALAAAATYALSPAIIFDSAAWGQTDGIVYVVVMLGLLCTLKQRGLWAGILFGLAVMLKPQPAIFLPLMLFYLWRWAGRREFWRSVIGLAGTVLVICLPYILPPFPEIFLYLRNIGGWASFNAPTEDAYNLWWLIRIPRGDSLPHWGLLASIGIGLVLFALVYLIVLKGISRARAPKIFWLGAAVLALAFFAITALQHERYLYPALALLPLAAAYYKRAWLLYAVASITVFLNMAVPVILYDGSLYQEAPQWKNFFTLHNQLTSALQNSLAVVQVALFLCALAIFLLDLRRLASSVQPANAPIAPVGTSEEVAVLLHEGVD